MDVKTGRGSCISSIPAVELTFLNSYRRIPILPLTDIVFSMLSMLSHGLRLLQPSDSFECELSRTLKLAEGRVYLQ